MRADGASEEQIAKVRMTPDVKKKLVDEFSSKRKNENGIEEEVSVNAEIQGVDTDALLTGDSNEELRMSDRLAEKSQNAKEGKMPRVTVEDIRPSQRLPREDAKDGLLIKEERKGSGNSMSFNDGSKTPNRRSSMNKASPNFQKFDAGLKK